MRSLWKEFQSTLGPVQILYESKWDHNEKAVPLWDYQYDISFVFAERVRWQIHHAVHI